MIIALLLLLASARTPQVEPCTLEALANGSDAIVVGRVLRVLCASADGIAEAPPAAPGEAARCEGAKAIAFAEVDVERVLRGDPSMKRLWYNATGVRWFPCDVTEAIVGERALFFLCTGHAAATGLPVFHDGFLGRGKMPIQEPGGVPWLTASDDVIPPEDMPLEPEAREGRFRDQYWTSRVDTTLDVVASLLRTRGYPLPAHPVNGALPSIAIVEGAFVRAALWPDGTIVWSRIGEAAHRQGRIDPARLEDLDVALDRDLGPDAPPGDGAARLTTRRWRNFHDVALDATATEAAFALRDRILRLLPEDGALLERALRWH